MHALIIEQDMWITLMIEDVLRDLGYTSFAFAASSEAAMDAVKARSPDLVTSAIRFGAGSAIEAVRKICAAGAMPRPTSRRCRRRSSLPPSPPRYRSPPTIRAFRRGSRRRGSA